MEEYYNVFEVDIDDNYEDIYFEYDYLEEQEYDDNEYILKGYKIIEDYGYNNPICILDKDFSFDDLDFKISNFFRGKDKIYHSAGVFGAVKSSNNKFVGCIFYDDYQGIFGVETRDNKLYFIENFIFNEADVDYIF